MKPIKTWIVLANAQTARFFVNTGPAKGLQSAGNGDMQAQPPTPYADRAGTGHSSAGPAVSAVEQRDPKDMAETQFADVLCDYLRQNFEDGQFERLVIAAGPHMLGKLRKALPDNLAQAVVAEIHKDLTQIPIKDLPDQLQDVMVI